MTCCHQNKSPAHISMGKDLRSIMQICPTDIGRMVAWSSASHEAKHPSMSLRSAKLKTDLPQNAFGEWRRLTWSRKYRSYMHLVELRVSIFITPFWRVKLTIISYVRPYARCRDPPGLTLIRMAGGALLPSAVLEPQPWQDLSDGSACHIDSLRAPEENSAWRLH